MKFSKLSKILTVVLLVSVLAISLIACSTSKDNKDEKQSTDSSISTLMASIIAPVEIYSIKQSCNHSMFSGIELTRGNIDIATKSPLASYDTECSFLVVFIDISSYTVTTKARITAIKRFRFNLIRRLRFSGSHQRTSHNASMMRT